MRLCATWGHKTHLITQRQIIKKIPQSLWTKLLCLILSKLQSGTSSHKHQGSFQHPVTWRRVLAIFFTMPQLWEWVRLDGVCFKMTGVLCRKLYFTEWDKNKITRGRHSILKKYHYMKKLKEKRESKEQKNWTFKRYGISYKTLILRSVIFPRNETDEKAQPLMSYKFTRIIR